MLKTAVFTVVWLPFFPVVVVVGFVTGLMGAGEALPAVRPERDVDNHLDAERSPVPVSTPERVRGDNAGGIYLGMLRPSSRRVQATALENVARILSGGRTPAVAFPWASIRAHHVRVLEAQLGHRYAPATVRRHLAAVACILREAHRLGQLEADALVDALEALRGQSPASRL